jgi:hypothetical protein
MLLEWHRCIFSFLNETNHSLSAFLIKSIEIMIFNFSKIINILLECGLISDQPWLSFIILVLSWHQCILKVGNESNSCFKFNYKRLLECYIPCASDGPRRLPVEVAILSVTRAFNCEDIWLISYFDFPNIFLCNIELIIISYHLNFVRQLMATHFFSLI